MATSEFWQKISTSESSFQDWTEGSAAGPVRGPRGKTYVWMTLDAMTILAAAVFATLYRVHTGPLASARGFWHGTLINGRSMGILIALL